MEPGLPVTPFPPPLWNPTEMGGDTSIPEIPFHAGAHDMSQTGTAHGVHQDARSGTRFFAELQEQSCCLLQMQKGA